MAANNTAALAALKAARNSVYAELAAHNNIDTTARAADWADVTDALQTKLEDLVHSIASLSKPTATPTSEPRNSSVRSDVPKLDSSNPAADFPIYGSQVQTMAKQQGFDINDPDGLLATTHKSWLASLPPEVPRPRTVVTRSGAVAERFATTERGGVVVKPARASGGRGVGLVRDGLGELASAFDAASRAGDGWVVVQAYIPEADEGEKRLLWLDGELIGGYRRLRAPGDFRHNLRRGASPEAAEVDDADRRAVAALDPHLKRAGVWFAGIDLIGGRLVEVNVLNPGGAHFTTLLGGVAVGERLAVALERLGAAPAPDYQRGLEATR